MLLDTCVVIDFLRGHDGAVAYIEELQQKPTLSAVTVAELFSGLKSQRMEATVRGFIRSCHVVSVSPAIAEAAGMAMRQHRASHGLGIVDALIAATAEHHEITLATQNVKHFPMFPRLKPAY